MKSVLPWLAAYFLLSAQDGVLFIDRMLYGTWDGKTGDTVSRLLNSMFISSGLLLFLYGTFSARRGIPRAGVALGASFVALLMCSALWSTDPAATVRVATLYLFVLVGMVGLVRSLDVGQFMTILTQVCLASALMSFALRFVSPAAAFSVSVDTIDFNGTFSSKNVLGQVMAAGALGCLYGLRTEQRGRIGKFATLAVFCSMAFASKSTAALLVTIMFISLSLYFSMRKKGGSAKHIANIVAIAVTPLFLVAVLAPDAALEMIGKDPTLTGRTEIWGYVCDYIAMKPLLGWGYFGFWNMHNPAAIAISVAVHWTVPESHNGLLELLLTTGFLGTAFALFLFSRNLALGIKCLGGPHREAGIVMIMCCTGLLMEGVSEMVLLSPTSALSGVFFAMGMFCEQALRERKRSRKVLQQSAFQAISQKLPAC